MPLFTSTCKLFHFVLYGPLPVDFREYYFSVRAISTFLKPSSIRSFSAVHRFSSIQGDVFVDPLLGLSFARKAVLKRESSL